MKLYSTPAPAQSMYIRCFFFLLPAFLFGCEIIASAGIPGGKMSAVNHAPVFVSKTYSYNVLENVSPGSSAGMVSANDQDGDQLTYSITGGNTNSTLRINPSTGSITVTKRLDHHTQDKYSLTLKVTDPAGLSDLASVMVSVQAGGSFPDFTNINWGTAKKQIYATHEIHGEVVNGRLYMFGGYDVLKRPKYTPTKRAYVYDPVADSWAPVADLPHKPTGSNFGGVTHNGLTTDHTDIYFAGGYPSAGNGTSQAFGTKEVWKYTVATNTFTALPNLPVELAAGQLRYLKGRIHYFSGANKPRQDVNVHYVLNLDSLALGWKSLSPVLNARNHGGSVVYGGKIYFVGGSHGQNDDAVAQKTLEVYDPNTNTWAKLADMPVARDHISSAVVVIGDRIVVLGGETTHNVRSKLVSAYSPASNTWQELTPLPVAKGAGVASILNSNIFYTGGNYSDLNYKGLPVIPNGNIQVDSFTLIDADKDTRIKTLANGDNINPMVLNAPRLNILANANTAKVRSIKLQLTGPESQDVTESKAPYTLFGDDGQGDYYPWTPPVGQYTLKATPYSGSGGTGTAGTSKTVTFTVTGDAAESITLSPIADAFIRNGSYANTNYGKDTGLEVKSVTSSGFTRQTYLKFSLSDIGSVGAATLRIYGQNTSDAAGVNIHLFGVNTDSWTETDIRFNNAPAPAGSPLSSVLVNSSAKYYEFDVTNFVKAQLSGDKVVSLFIKDPVNNDKRLIFNSREHSKNRPQLIIVPANLNKPMVLGPAQKNLLFTSK